MTSIDSALRKFDLVVIGAGPGGYVAAIRGAQLGGKVAIIEKSELGGVCLNEGCIPTKFLLEVVEVIEAVRKAAALGITTTEPRVDWTTIRERKRLIVKRLTNGIAFLMKKYRIQVFKGSGNILNPTRVEVKMNEGHTIELETKKIILATGSRPSKIPVPGVDSEGVITSNKLLEIDELPKSMIIVGGGPEGVEFANILQTFGTDVTIVEMLPRLLPLEDGEIGSELRKIMEKKGITVLTSSKLLSIGGALGQKTVKISTQEGEKELKAEMVLLAAGRRPNVEGIGLEALNMKFSKAGVNVNERMHTNIDGVYAIGDAAGKYLLAYTASEEGMVASENALGREAEIEYQVIPRCIFTKPEVAAVGLTEEQAREQGYRVKVGRFPFRANSKAISQGHTDGFVKVVAREDDGLILGVHIIGLNAAELIHEATLGVKLGATVEDLYQTLHAHPTLSEALREAALDVRELAIHKG